jgi:hypothetical protein
MMTLSSIISHARKAYGQEMELRYLHPTLYLVCKDPYFASLSTYEKNFRCFELRPARVRLPISILYTA